MVFLKEGNEFFCRAVKAKFGLCGWYFFLNRSISCKILLRHFSASRRKKSIFCSSWNFGWTKNSVWEIKRDGMMIIWWEKWTFVSVFCRQIIDKIQYFFDLKIPNKIEIALRLTSKNIFFPIAFSSFCQMPRASRNLNCAI